MIKDIKEMLTKHCKDKFVICYIHIMNSTKIDAMQVL